MVDESLPSISVIHSAGLRRIEFAFGLLREQQFGNVWE